jgi:hypothetical protein
MSEIPPPQNEEEAPPEEEIPPELQEEIALGGTPAGVATNEALRAMARAARSFLIYDPRNEAIRGFLQSYRDSMQSALKQFDEIDLDIRPFEMVRGGEVVYLERDRDRSLAFRMFRDGVRRLTIEPDVAWEELLRLLEILSIRFTGIRQQEDDIVTLLLKSGFKSIEIAAVEGFVPDDDEYCGDDPNAAAARRQRESRRAESHVDVPRDWDLPIPTPMAPAELRYFEVSEDELDSIRTESSSLALAKNTVRLVVEMLRVVGDPTDPTTPDDVEGLINEVRDFLLSEGQLSALLRLVDSVREELRHDRKAAEEILATFANLRALRRILGSVPKGQEEVPQDLLDLLDLVPSDHLENLVTLLETERTPTARTILRKLITRYATDKLDYGLNRMEASEASVAADLFEALIDAKPELAVDIVKAALKRTEAEMQLRALQVMEKIDDIVPLKAELYKLLKAGLDEVRIKTLPFLVEVRDIKLFPSLLDHIEKSSGMSNREAEAFGETLAKVNPRAAQRTMVEWVKPRGMFSLRGVTIKKHQQWAAVSALGVLPDDGNPKLIMKLRDEAGEELANHCSKVMYKRRRDGTIEDD